MFYMLFWNFRDMFISLFMLKIIRKVERVVFDIVIFIYGEYIKI